MSLAFTLVRDAKLLRGLTTADHSRTDTLAFQLQRHAAKHGERVFLRYLDRTYTYAEANALINRHAYAYKVLGVGQGDVVALMMENRPEYLFHVYALHKIGAVSSLINSQVTGDVLIHALRTCEPKHVVVGSELWSNYVEVASELTEISPQQVHVDEDESMPVASGIVPFARRLEEASDFNPPEYGTQTLGELAAFIYTSGTTGMPKAAKITHYRMWRAGAVWAGIALRYESNDVMYNCLPLYHSNGFLLATGSVVSAGVTMALARKFSLRGFWDDIRRHEATTFIYIGELCRYLMNAPESERDREHRVRAITGNGLRPDIWERFRARFGIDRVAEFYAATEGNCITINFANRVASVGPLMPGMALARWDEENQEFLRDHQGFMIAAKRGQSGILLGKIRPKAEFDGYKDTAATEQKILHDVFEKGDAYFNSGDLLRLGGDFHLYFMDRLGDTFRWKGENVATFEVQEQIMKLATIAEANVYGVQIEGTDGRAGMAALVMTKGQVFDPEAFKLHVQESLPAYARPVFVRLQPALEKTGTFKVKKVELQKQGFNPALCQGDDLWFYHPQEGTYVSLDHVLYNKIQAGEFRL